MKKRLVLFQFFGFTFTCLLGSFLHFLFDLTPSSPITAIFSAVNESTWEHMKIMYFPLLIVTLAEKSLFKDLESFLLIKFKGLIISLGLIPLIFYTYKGILGFNVDWINISIFFISAGIGFIYETKEFQKEKSNSNESLYLILYLLIGVLFAVFTFYTPKLGIFSDPINGTYGFQT